MACAKFKRMSTEEQFSELGTLGLGTGVDMTDAEPWNERSSYQVCRIRENLDNVRVVDEGGNWLHYANVAFSRQELQSEVKFGITVPDTPITINADAEFLRTKNSSRKTRGRRLVDCKVSIIPDNLEGEKPEESFEDRLSSWLKEKYEHYVSTAKAIQETFGIQRLEVLLDRTYENSELDSLKLDEAEKQLLVAVGGHQGPVDGPQSIPWKALIELCVRFIKSFRVTHFVRTLELGVLEYEIEKETEEGIKAGGGAGVAASSLASASLSTRLYWQQITKSMRINILGALDQDGKEIKRLAVLSVDVYPITKLVTSPFLKLGLQKALNDYIEEREEEEENQHRRGPFMITIEDDMEFFGLKVSDSYTLEATPNREEASPFFLGPSDNIREDEFYIVYYGPTLINRKGRLLAPNLKTRIPYYLEADTSLFGGNDGPLHFKPNTDSDEPACKFKFEVPMNEKNSAQLILKGKGLFYICCERKWKMSSYIFLRKSGDSSTGFNFQSGCTHSKAQHDQDTRFMLFRLQEFEPSSYTAYLNASNSFPLSALASEVKPTST